jgi:radical SAM protein with 4Fe4S-binding SPASM domain
VILSVRRGHCPNCSASGAVVGLALLSAAAAAVLVNSFADRFSRWREGEPSEPGHDRSKARVRDEAGAAWLALPGTAALLLVDPTAAQAALDAGAVSVGSGEQVPGAWSAPLEAHVALSGRCPVRCTDCYLQAGPDGPEVELQPLLQDLDRLAAMGVFEIALGGGETGFDERLFQVAEHVRARGMVPNLTTSGFGLDEAKARRAAAVFGQVNVSMDGLGAAYRAARGWDGAALALRSISLLADAGARVGVNTVLTRSTAPGLEALGEELARRGVCEWQWLRLKPEGRAAALYERERLSPEQALQLWPRALQIEASTGLVLRWDCAMVPFLAAHDVPVETLRALCVEGCSGGRSLLARTVSGSWAPCSFAHPEQQPGAPDEIWRSGDALTAWRARAATPAEPCASCPAQPFCRGGCRIVARHISGDPLAPDPECPKVRSRSEGDPR